MTALVQERPLKDHFSGWLRRAQWLSIYILVLITANSYRWVVLTIQDVKPNVLAEWQGVVVYPPDFVLLALLIFSLLRMGIDVNYAERLRQTIYRLFHKNQAWVWVLWVVWCGLGIIWAHQPIITAFNALQLALTLAMVFVLADLVQIEQTRS